MANNAHDIRYTMTKQGIMAHPHVITPVAYSPDGKPARADAKKSYSCSFVLDLDHPDVAPMKAAIVAAAKAKWPGLDIAAEAAAGRLKVPFSSGDKQIAKRTTKLKAKGKEYTGDADFQKGKIVFKASSDFPPALGVRVLGQGDIDVTEDNKGLHKGAFYFGSEGLGAFTFRPYDPVGEDGKPGVKMYLDMVHSLNRGKHLQTQRSAAEAFKGVAGSAVDVDPTIGQEDTSDEGEAF